MVGVEHQRRGHPVADLLGAVLRGGRPEDTQARRRAKKWVAGLAGGSLAAWIAVVAVGDWRDQAREARHSAQSELVAALRDQTSAIKQQSISIDNLVWSLWEVQTNGAREHAAMMKRMGVPPVAPVVRPPRTLLLPAPSGPAEPIPSSSNSNKTYDPSITGPFAP